MTINRMMSRVILTVMLLLTMCLVATLPVHAASRPNKVTGVVVSAKADVDAATNTAGLTVKWSKAKNAKTYQLAYKTGDNAWVYKTTKSTKIGIKGLNPYCKYDIKVRGANGKTKGSWSKTINSYTKPASFEVDFPDLAGFKIANRGLGSITVSWDYRDPTDDEMTDYSRIKFDVFCSTDGYSWTKVASALPSTTKSYTQRGCNQDVTYYFKVVSYDNTSYKTFTVKGPASKVVSAEVRKPDGLVIEKRYTKANDEYIFNRSYNLRGLMLHSVGGNVQSADEWFNRYNGSMKSTASVHGFIDGYDGHLLQTLSWDVRAGHAGAAGNNRYIGIEMCESQYLKYASDSVHFEVEAGHLEDAKSCARITYNTAVKLFATLCDYYGLNPTKKGVIVSHCEWGHEYYDISGGGHEDPEHYWNQLGTGYSMDKFRSDVKALLQQYQ